MTDYSKITALYSRLSVGDEDRDGGESNSIQNQKIFLENYARGQHLTNIRHYIDDDESGRFFDRSAYSRMMDDVENGKIGVCIMKDLTRWGRDYLQVGNAMEIFRRNNVRFIAVNNGIDSEKPDTLEFAPFINIMSEWYAKDISKKVKTGIKTKGMSGKPIVTEAPYGYVKDPDNKDFWIIDEEAAEVVRLIFRLFIGGKNRNQIAVHLKNEQIPTPTFYMKDRGRGTCKNKTLNEDSRCKWNKATFYDTYHKNMEKMAEEYGKTSVQKKYLEKKYNEIKLPVEYESYSSWDTMIMYVETYSIILAIIVGFICAGIFADDFQTKADAVFFSTKYGRTKAVKTKILAGIATTVMIYCMGIILLSVICFGIMGTSGMNTPYQMYQAYSIYIMSYGQYYLLTVVCGFIASMLAAVVSMLVAAKMHTISVAVCIPFFLYCLLPFIGRALSGYTTLFNLIPTILTNVQASVKVPLIYQIGNCVFRQIPLVMVMYTVMAIALLPFIYKSFRRYGNK